MRFLALLLFLLPGLAMAEEKDSLFADYADYSAYVDKMITARDWEPFILRMGARDEYTPEELSQIAGNFTRLFPRPFTARTLFREVDLGGGLRQEARAYWGGGRYLFFQAIMHERSDALVVLNFTMNTRIEAIMQKY